MLSTISWPSIDSLINAEVSFTEMGELFTDLYKCLIGHENFVSVWSKIGGVISTLGIITTVALLVLSVVQLLFGRKLINFQAFLLFFAAGFVAGTSLLAPLLAGVGMAIPPWIIGLIAGIVAALFSKVLFFVGYVFAAGYATYMVSRGGHLLPDSLVSFVKGNMIICLVSVALVVTIAIVFRGWVAIIVTSALGGYCVSLCLRTLLAELAGISLGKVFVIVASVLLALLGYMFQFKTRSGKRR